MKDRIYNDSLVSKAEWKRYCETLKNINKELSDVCRQQNADLQEIILLADVQWWFRIIFAVPMRETLLNILKKYRDNPWYEFKETNEEKGQRPAEAPKQGDMVVDARQNPLPQSKD